jgi:23S rRNA (guanosine2251-2'-O)-methyltransferase
MLIEGRNVTEQALDGNGTVDKVFIDRDFKDEKLIAKVKASGAVYQFVDRKTLNRMSKTKNHQGIMAFVTDYSYFNIDDIIDRAYAQREQPVILILDGVEDPHNLGNIIRTAECMGVDGIILPKNRSASVNDTVVRVAMGAASHVPICKVTNINHEIDKLQQRGFWVYAAELGGVDMSTVNMLGPVAVVMGGEGEGIHQLTRRLVDLIISVEMRGKVNSLTVGAAAAMVMYEINRQRKLGRL